MSELLEVTDLVKHFPLREVQGLKMVRGNVRAVDGVSFSVEQGQTLGLVGESGCGKSTTSRLVTRLLEPTSGSIRFEGQELAHASEAKLRPYRRDLQIVFQDPYSSLNPRHTVATILSTPLRVHGLAKGREKQRVQELLELVGLNPEHINRYPNEFSGGQRQRIGIARALAVEPKLIIADEPVSALDVSIQAQVMNLLGTLRRELDLAFIFIAHDLGVVRHFCDRVAVMYLGKIVEQGDRHQIYTAPQHPTRRRCCPQRPTSTSCAACRPRSGSASSATCRARSDPPSGCRFRTRCWKAQDLCAQVEPPLMTSVEDTTSVRAKRDRGLHLQAATSPRSRRTSSRRCPPSPWPDAAATPRPSRYAAGPAPTRKPAPRHTRWGLRSTGLMRARARVG
jgi:peptide/nickel transport system ATP-binding protein